MSNLEDELGKIRELLRAGALTEREFQQAKATLLQGDVPADCSLGSVTEEQLAQVRLAIELERIDREWQAEQERYYVDYSVEGEDTRQEPPNAIGTVCVSLAGLGSIGLGIWLLAEHGHLLPFCIFGILGIGLPTWFAVKYFRYKRGLRRYQRQREELHAKMTGGGRASRCT